MANRIVVVTMAAISLAGCVTQPDKATQTEALLLADAEFARYSREHGAANAFDEYLSEDAIQLPSRGDVVKGRTLIVDGLKSLDDGWILDWTPVHAEVSPDGAMGYTWGRYELYKAATPGSKSTGKYLNVWRLDPHGKWKVIADIGNQQPAIPD